MAAVAPSGWNIAGLRDWAVGSTSRIPVSAGQVLELRGWLKVDQANRAELCVTSYDAKGKVIEWSMVAAETRGTHDWREMRRLLVVPEGCAAVQVRFTGFGPGTAWVDDVSLAIHGDLSKFQAGVKNKNLAIDNRWLSVRFDAISGTLAVTDKRTNQAWEQKQIDRGVVVTDAEVRRSPIELSLLALGDDLRLKARSRCSGSRRRSSLPWTAKADDAGTGVPATFRHRRQDVDRAADERGDHVSRGRRDGDADLAGVLLGSWVVHAVVGATDAADDGTGHGGAEL